MREAGPDRSARSGLEQRPTFSQTRSLDELVSAVVQVKTYIEPEGRTVDSLGREREGSGIVIDNGDRPKTLAWTSIGRSGLWGQRALSCPPTCLKRTRGGGSISGPRTASIIFGLSRVFKDRIGSGYPRSRSEQGFEFRPALDPGPRAGSCDYAVTECRRSPSSCRFQPPYGS